MCGYLSGSLSIYKGGETEVWIKAWLNSFSERNITSTLRAVPFTTLPCSSLSCISYSFLIAYVDFIYPSFARFYWSIFYFSSISDVPCKTAYGRWLCASLVGNWCQCRGQIKLKKIEKFVAERGNLFQSAS